MNHDFDIQGGWPDPEFLECEHCGLDYPPDQLEHYETDYKWASSVLYCEECAKELEVYEQEE